MHKIRSNLNVLNDPLFSNSRNEQPDPDPCSVIFYIQNNLDFREPSSKLLLEPRGDFITFVVVELLSRSAVEYKYRVLLNFQNEMRLSRATAPASSVGCVKDQTIRNRITRSQA